MLYLYMRRSPKDWALLANIVKRLHSPIPPKDKLIGANNFAKILVPKR